MGDGVNSTFDVEQENVRQRQFSRYMRAQERETLRGLPVHCTLDVSIDSLVDSDDIIEESKAECVNRTASVLGFKSTYSESDRHSEALEPEGLLGDQIPEHLRQRYTHLCPACSSPFQNYTRQREVHCQSCAHSYCLVCGLHPDSYAHSLFVIRFCCEMLHSIINTYDADSQSAFWVVLNCGQFLFLSPLMVFFHSILKAYKFFLYHLTTQRQFWGSRLCNTVATAFSLGLGLLAGVILFFFVSLPVLGVMPLMVLRILCFQLRVQVRAAGNYIESTRLFKLIVYLFNLIVCFFNLIFRFLTFLRIKI
jgi:hypothetical protein